MTVDDVHAARFKEPPKDAPYRWAIIRLQQRIAASGLSISEFAQTVGFPRAPNTVYHWLRGRHPIPAETRRWLQGNPWMTEEEEATTTADKEATDG